MSIHRGFSVAGLLARRSLVVCAASGLIASTALTPLLTAHAQTAQPQAQQQVPAPQAQQNTQPWPGPPITAQTTTDDPPARVGRIAKMSGTVSFHTADEDQWGPATLNYPLTAGNALWTEPEARAELQIGSANRLVMDSSTELNVVTLDDTHFEASLPQGGVYLNASDLLPGDSYTIQTPRGTVEIATPGRYAIAAGDDEKPTTVTVLDGSAKLGGRGLTQAVPAGQTATLTGSVDGDDPVQAALVPQQQDRFVQSVLADEAPKQAAAPAAATPAPAVAAPVQPQAAAAPAPRIPVGTTVAMPQEVQGMTGAQDLAAYGTWSSAPTYGTVWYPPVEAGWVPYRHGHWAYIQPWGWTWVAEEPWGFAPFHYGRWVTVHGRWAWSPGIPMRHRHHHHYRPVYSPALVAFFGSSNGVSISIGIGGGNVGWVPLGWHEPYYPPYRVSRTYIRNVNVTHVTNITRVTNVTRVNNVTVNKYVNRNSVTVVPANAMRESRPVQRSIQTVDRRQIANMRSERRPQIQPTAATAGMSPQAARRMGITDGNREAQRQTAPGPRIRPESLRRDENDQRRQQPAVTSRDTRNGPAMNNAAIQNGQRSNAGRPDMRNGRDTEAARTAAPAPRPRDADQAGRTDQRREQNPQARQPAQQPMQRQAGQDGQQNSRERPDAQRSGVQKPETRRPETQRPDMRGPEVQRPETQRPDMQRQQVQQQDRQRQDLQRQENQRQMQQQNQRQQEMQRQQFQQQERQRQDSQRQMQRQQEAQRQQQDMQRQQQARQQESQRQMQAQQQQRQQTEQQNRQRQDIQRQQVQQEAQRQQRRRDNDL